MTDHALTITLGNAADLAWAQATVKEHHYLRQPVDSRARPMVYVVNLHSSTLQWSTSNPKLLERAGSSERVGLVMMGIPHATKCGGWWGYPGLPTQWQTVDLCRIWFEPGVQAGGCWCRPGVVPGFIDRCGVWQPTVATWAIAQVLARVQADRVRMWPPVYPAQPYHIELAISYHDPKFHKGTIYRLANALPMYTDVAGQPVPGPSGKFGWAWRLERPAWTWDELSGIQSCTLRMF